MPQAFEIADQAIDGPLLNEELSIDIVQDKSLQAYLTLFHSFVQEIKNLNQYWSLNRKGKTDGEEGNLVSYS